MSEPRWTEVEPSQFAHERAALDFVRRRLPDNDPWRAWSNFTFMDDHGRTAEVDLLVVAPTGVHLVEIKSYPSGRLTADPGTWRWFPQDKGPRSYDNPLLGADSKAKRLKDLLLRQSAMRGVKYNDLWVNAAVFLSSPTLKVEFDPRLQPSVFGPDAETDQVNQLNGLIAHLTGADATTRQRRVNTPLSHQLAQAMDQADIRQSEKYRRAGSYRFDELLEEGDAWQDFRAHHAASKLQVRARVHVLRKAASEEDRDSLNRAAEREFRLLHGIRHSVIDSPQTFEANPHGPVTVYPYDPDAIRLDHWLAQHPDLELDDRLTLFRTIAEGIGHAHDKKVAHRSLQPRRIWISDPDSNPTPRIRGWSTVARDDATNLTTSDGTRHAGHLQRLAGAHAGPYMAPELLTSPNASGRLADVFALGAILHLLVSDKPPAVDGDDLRATLAQHRHIPLAASMDGAPLSLSDLVAEATQADASQRLQSVDDVLAGLDLALEDLTLPDSTDLLEATRGTEIDGWRIVGRIGAGASSIVLLAERGGTPEVLKVARDEHHAQRLRDERDALDRLRGRAFIGVYGCEEVAGRTVLRLEPGLMATDNDRITPRTLASSLREVGPPSLDFLERWGTDLLDALVAMEREGVNHRDLKPENLVIVERGKDKERHLAVIDFSLTRAPSDDLDAGTVGYLDPFLRERRRQRWDLNAERYAAAMVLAELATGDRPSWGDGVDPASTTRDTPEIRTSGIEPSIADGLVGLLRRALHRDPSRRFDTADDLRREWQRLFTGIDDSTGHPVGLPAGEVDLSGVTPSTPISELGLQPAVASLVERLGAGTVGELARLPRHRITSTPGAGAVIRREVRHLLERLAAAGLAEDPEVMEDLDPAATQHLAVDGLSRRLVPPSNLPEQVKGRLRALLGLDVSAGLSAWPTVTATAQALGEDVGEVSADLNRARQRWAGARPELTILREELKEWLVAKQGIATGDELADVLLGRRGSVVEEEIIRRRHARAVIRAVVEAESWITYPKFRAIRAGDELLVAVDDIVEVPARGTVAFDADPLADVAVALGDIADRLVADGEVVTPTTAVARLREVAVPDGIVFDDARLVALAAATSTNAAVSSRRELYPVGLDAIRAIAAARLALLEHRGLPVADLRSRVAARFPRAEKLPGRPALDDKLEAADVGMVWDPEPSRYVMEAALGVWSSSTRYSTTRYSNVDAADLDVEQLERMLARVRDEGGFVVATVKPNLLDAAASAVAAVLDAPVLDLNAVLVGALRQVADDAGAEWQALEGADAAEPTTQAHAILRAAVRRALPAVHDQLDAAGPVVVATGIGLLARYDAVSLLATWRETLTRSDTPRTDGLQGLVVVVPGEDPDAKPTIDGIPVPVVTAGEYTHIPSIWLDRVTP